MPQTQGQHGEHEQEDEPSDDYDQRIYDGIRANSTGFRRPQFGLRPSTIGRDTRRAMSHENVEIVRAAVEAADRGDWDAMFKDAAPDFEVDLSRAVGPFQGVYSLAQIRAVLDEFSSTWESLRFEPPELIDAGEHIVVPWTMYARGRDGIEVPSRVTWVWTVRDGAIVRACMYQEREHAFEAAGLRE